MHNIEPYSNWDYLYASEEDEQSPFYGREYNEFAFENTIYNYYIHPLWDYFGSKTLYLKILMADYETGYVIIELIGEWNDAIENDIMTLKREVIDQLQDSGINKFILITENVLNFHSSDDCYYEEWADDVQENDGWIAFLNMPEQTQYDFKNTLLDQYVRLLDVPDWRTFKPDLLFEKVSGFQAFRIDY